MAGGDNDLDLDTDIVSHDVAGITNALKSVPVRVDRTGRLELADTVDPDVVADTFALAGQRVEDLVLLASDDGRRGNADSSEVPVPVEFTNTLEAVIVFVGRARDTSILGLVIKGSVEADADTVLDDTVGRA